jgi:hypothetical protein
MLDSCALSSIDNGDHNANNVMISGLPTAATMPPDTVNTTRTINPDAKL